MIQIPEETTLRENNPYANGAIFVFEDGSYELERNEVEFIKSERDRYYTVKEGDTLNLIAYRAYGDSKWYWILKDANKIDFALDLPVGKTLLIPDLGRAKLTLNTHGR